VSILFYYRECIALEVDRTTELCAIRKDNGAGKSELSDLEPTLELQAVQATACLAMIPSHCLPRIRFPPMCKRSTFH